MDDESFQSISHGFKITVVILVFLFVAIRLASAIYFPSSEIIPDKVFLFIVLSILIYLWIQEMIDLQNLVKMNRNLSEAHEQLKASEIDTIAALIKAEEAKDLYTSGHSEMVRKIALAISEEMNLSDEKKNVISRAAILHDIGKIGISDAILNKKEKLTEAEMNVIREHPENAMAILESIKFLLSEKEIILQHHERYDGKGYPKGLKGNEICFEASVISIADTFDAMNSRRAYREALTRDIIIAELQKCRGTQHSAEVIDVFLALLEKNPRLWER